MMPKWTTPSCPSPAFPPTSLNHAIFYQLPFWLPANVHSRILRPQNYSGTAISKDFRVCRTLPPPVISESSSTTMTFSLLQLNLRSIWMRKVTAAWKTAVIYLMYMNGFTDHMCIRIMKSLYLLVSVIYFFYTG